MKKEMYGIFFGSVVKEGHVYAVTTLVIYKEGEYGKLPSIEEGIENVN
jgi:hypothetical protein